MGGIGERWTGGQADGWTGGQWTKVGVGAASTRKQAAAWCEALCGPTMVTWVVCCPLAWLGGEVGGKEEEEEEDEQR